MEKIGVELETAITIITAHVKRITRTETVDLFAGTGRILAADIIAPFDNPPFPRSPLDGYTFRAGDSQGAGTKTPASFEIVGTVYAGDCFDGVVGSRQAVKITTGAPIPKGCDCVVRQEDVTIREGRLLVPFPMKAHQNYCYQGEDFHRGEVLVKKGTRLSYIEIGILASAGINPVPVYQRPVIALLTTGDEVVMPGEELGRGKIYGSNLHMLYSRLQAFGAEVRVIGQAGDDVGRVSKVLKEAALYADAIITTGGVSVGDKDIFHQVLPEIGCRRLFWRVNLKPGTPAMFSLLDQVPILSLSGNPFAAITTFELLGRPLLGQLSGDVAGTSLEKAEGVLAADFLKASPGRRFIRGLFAKGQVEIPFTDKHASGMLASMAGCNCLIDIKPGTRPLQQGDRVSLWKL